MAGERVLVVEDNEKNMKLVRDILQATGYSPLEASSGEQALALAAEHAPALVLMDIQLPDLDGAEALQRLRSDERTAGIPVLALTAQAYAGGPRTLPRCRLRRLPVQARRRRRADRDRSALLRRRH